MTTPDKKAGIHEDTIVPPSFSSDGNVGIEQQHVIIGAYTKCCLGEPVHNGLFWICWKCETQLLTYVPSKGCHTLDLRGSSSEEIAVFIADWLNRPHDLVEVSISWPGKEV